VGIGAESLRGWVRQAQADAAGGTASVLASAERERLEELEREVRELRKAKEILKAASVFLVLLAFEWATRAGLRPIIPCCGRESRS
jgi:transposase-like protein